MNTVKLILLSLFPFVFTAYCFTRENVPTREELDLLFKDEWNKPEYNKANSAENVSYLTQDEKDVFYYLNLARINPKLFAKTYVTHFVGKKDVINDPTFEERKQSLIKELSEMKPLNILIPNELISGEAECFATAGGIKGIIGHERDSTGCNMLFAECCSYANTDGLLIVLDLLIDPGIKNAELGHRKICLSNYGMAGISIKPHINAKYIAVLQFGFNPDIIYTDNHYSGYLSLRGLRTGKGVYTFSENSKYEGEWLDDKMHGAGIYTYTNGDYYSGEWKNGLKDGYGEYTYINGDKYEGEWKNGQREGNGIYTYKNGANYNGEWKEGSRNGKGIHTYSNGAVYNGNWLNDRMHGPGIYTSSKGIVSEEHWINGVKQEELQSAN